MYGKDIFATALEELRKAGDIQDYKHKKSRANLSHDELAQAKVRKAFAKALGVDKITGAQVRLPRAIEWNVIGNMHHEDWGNTDAYEWFEDSYQAGRGRLFGGDSDDGGLSGVRWGNPGYRSGGLGFRFLVRFSQ